MLGVGWCSGGVSWCFGAGHLNNKVKNAKSMWFVPSKVVTGYKNFHWLGRSGSSKSIATWQGTTKERMADGRCHVQIYSTRKRGRRYTAREGRIQTKSNDVPMKMKVTMTWLWRPVTTCFRRAHANEKENPLTNACKKTTAKHRRIAQTVTCFRFTRRHTFLPLST